MSEFFLDDLSLNFSDNILYKYGIMNGEPWIYLDNNATTRMDERVVQAMLPYFSEAYANAGSAHLFGHSILEAIENAQQHTAELVNARPQEIIFTSGATESVNLAIKGLRHYHKKHIVTLTTEHKAVLDTCGYMEKEGFKVTYLKVSRNGLADMDELKEAITENTCLVCVMLANNETGVIHPVKAIAAIANEKGAFFMSDAAQAVGKLPVDVKALQVDFLPFSAHKFYGPKGIGGLYVSPEAQKKLDIQIHGGGQQRNRRSGTLNVSGIVALGKACELAQAEMVADRERITNLRDLLEDRLLQVADTYVNGNKEKRLYNTTNICFRGVEAERVILALQRIAVSNGSACSAISSEPSHVLTAMGHSDTDALASIRFTLGRFNTREDIEITSAKMTDLVHKFRS